MLAGSSGERVNLVLLAALAGGYLPWRMGLEFLAPLVILPYSLIGVAAASAAAGEADGAMVRRMVAHGTGYSAAVLAMGLAAVNFQLDDAPLVLPPWPTLVAAMCLAAATSFTAGARALTLSGRYYSVRDVKMQIRGTLLLLLVVWILRPWIVPVAVREWLAPLGTTWRLSGLAVVLAGALSVFAWRQLQTAATRSSGPAAGSC